MEEICYGQRPPEKRKENVCSEKEKTSFTAIEGLDRSQEKVTMERDTELNVGGFGSQGKCIFVHSGKVAVQVRKQMGVDKAVIGES